MPIRVAVAQLALRLADIEGNLARCLAALDDAAAQGAVLVVLPEAALTGYVFDDPDAAPAAALDVPGPQTDALVDRCRTHGLHAVVGTLATDGARVRNTAVLVGPDGLLGSTASRTCPTSASTASSPRATARSRCTTRRWAGSACRSASTCASPSSRARSPSTAPRSSATRRTGRCRCASSPDFMTRARAVENRVFLLTANRMDAENGARFCGKSQIVDPLGRRLAIAGEDEEVVLVADVELDEARRRRWSRRPAPTRCRSGRSAGRSCTAGWWSATG